jgi:alanine racemase
MVLVKGSRPAKLEKVVDLLLTPLSPARVYVDLDKLSENLDRLRGLVGPSVKLMPVVKSFGYGLDSRKLAETFEASGADYLGVAYPDEGVALRRHGIHLPIMVQNVLPHEASKVVEHRLDAQISDLDTARRLGAHAQAYGREVGLHLKVDTGMGRAGVLPRAARELAAALVEVPGCKLVGLMTHLAAADEEAHDEFTRAQIASFRELRDDLQDDGIEFEVVHAANSAGSVRFPESHFSMVRSGIGLVGYLDLDAPEESPFAPIIRFVSQVVGVRELPPGHPVGYGLSWRASEGHRRLAVVAVGYNDGYPRHLSNKGWMMIAGTRCPVVGKVCMDVTMVDISDVSDEVSLGDEVVVYGTEPEEPDLADMAALAGTIPYELLTRISPRVRRIYRRER